MKILITGATGLIGRALGAQLAQQHHEILVITRDQSTAKSRLSYSAQFIEADLNHSPINDPRLKNIEAVYHLAGENIGEGRWTAHKKKFILNSRKNLTMNLVQSLQDSSQLHTFISASAVGFYGNQGDKWLYETSPCGSGFLAQVCQEWESAIQTSSLNCRKALFRIGVVFSSNGGALSKIKIPFRYHLGAPLGTGRQWMSWIHLTDLVQLFIEALNNAQYSGVFNACSPNPITNLEFSRTLAQQMKTILLPPVPAFALRLALGEQSEILLDSQRASCQKIQDLGFQFQIQDLKSALQK